MLIIFFSITLFLMLNYYVFVNAKSENFLWRVAVFLLSFSFILNSLYLCSDIVARVFEENKYYLYIFFIATILLLFVGGWEATLQLKQGDYQKVKEMRSDLQKAFIAFIIYLLIQYFG